MTDADTAFIIASTWNQETQRRLGVQPLASLHGCLQSWDISTAVRVEPVSFVNSSVVTVLLLVSTK